MKLPAVWMVAALGAGIELAVRWPQKPQVWTIVVACSLLAGAVLLWRRFAPAALLFALIGWFAIGGLAISAQRNSLPANHVSKLIASGRIDTDAALRWRGRLRESPQALPWGYRYEIDLDEVETASGTIPIKGGLRANLYGNEYPAQSTPGGLHAGDRVEALVRAQPPRNFLDPGAFDLRGYLADQKIDLVSSLRSGELLRRIGSPLPQLAHRLARVRSNLLDRIDMLFAGQPERSAVLRAMLLGDRSFVDTQTVADFQKTSAYHMLVLAGLHVGALVVFFFWLGRRLRLSVDMISLITIVALLAYVGVVQDRPPILRAALMAIFYLCARPFFRRTELLNTIGLAAIALLLWKPSSFEESSLQLSFVAAGVIAGLAMPWIERSSAPYRDSLAHLGDATRDGAHAPRTAQFRIEMLGAVRWITPRLPQRIASHANRAVTLPVRLGLRVWEVMLLSAVIQWGVLPFMARDFHRMSLTGPVSNIPAVILTGLIVPLGFLALLATFVWMRAALFIAKLLSLCTAALLATVGWFSRIPHFSYRIPDPPAWAMIAFFAVFIALAAAARRAAVLAEQGLRGENFPRP